MNQRTMFACLTIHKRSGSREDAEEISLFYREYLSLGVLSSGLIINGYILSDTGGPGHE